MHEDTVPEKRPYLLQADAEALLGLLQAIEMKVEIINRMAHLTPVRTYRIFWCCRGHVCHIPK